MRKGEEGKERKRDGREERDEKVGWSLSGWFCTKWTQ